jgi:hypothetical protein
MAHRIIGPAECSNGIARNAGGSVREIGDGKITDAI